MKTFPISPRKYLQITFGLLAPVCFAGCRSSAPQSAPPAATPRPVAQATIIPTPAPMRVIATPAPISKQSVVVPNPKLPSRNGYDVLVQAGKNLQPELPPKHSPAQMQAHLAKNAPALQLARTALKLPIVAPPQRTLTITKRYHPQLNQVARAFNEQAFLQANAGDCKAATQSALDAIEIGMAIQNGGGELTMSGSVPIQQIARRELARCIEKLDATQALRAAQRLEKIEAKRSNLATIETEKKWTELANLRLCFQKTDWKKFRAGQKSIWDIVFKNSDDLARLRKVPEAQIEANLIAKMDAAIARARDPFVPNLPPLPEAADPLSALLSRDVASPLSRVVYEKNLAQNRLMLTALALQAFIKSRGQYPKTFNELIPEILKAVPLDPFTPNAPLIYQRNGQKYALYSVGPDGSDDGGVATETRGIGPESIGDVMIETN